MEERIGRYVLQGRIGSGSTGTVYLALEPDIERWVTIKQLAPELAGDPEFLRRFRDEARIMARLNHPNCVKVFDFFEKRGSAYLVAEFVDGASLREVLRQAKRLTPQQALGVLKGALLGLAHAHSLGLVHRDIKPENLLCDREGTSKLADFGLTTSSGKQEDPSQGSPLYMSPEQVKGGSVDQRSDIYGCGTVLFEFLTGRPPFVAETRLAVMHMQASAPVPNPRQLNRRLSAPVAETVMKAMAKDPKDRHQSAEEFLAELEQAAKDAYGVGWEEGASIAGPTAAAIAAGAASATAGASAGTGAAVVGTQVAGTAAASAAAQPSSTHTVTSPWASSAGRKIVRRLMRPRVLAIVAVVAVLIVGVTAVVASNPHLLGSTKPTGQAGGDANKASPSSATAIPKACDVMTLDLAQSAIGSDAKVDQNPTTADALCAYTSQKSQISVFIDSWKRLHPIDGVGFAVSPVPGIGDEAYESVENGHLSVRKGTLGVTTRLYLDLLDPGNEPQVSKDARSAAAARALIMKLLAKL